MSTIFDLGLLNTIIRISTPLVLAAMGGLLTFQAGVLNIAMDGFMLMAAFVAIWIAHVTGNLAIAVIVAVLASVFVSVVFGLFNLKLKANIFIAGIALNMFASGLTAVLLDGILGERGVFASNRIPPFAPIELPVISKLPILSEILKGHTVLVYVAFLSVPLVSYALYRTKWGLRIRATGENAESAASVGLNTFSLKMQTVILSGLFCGLAGAYLSLGYVTLFSRDMNADRGLTALAAIFFARGNPAVAMVVAMLFGAAQAISVRLQQSAGVAPQLLQVIPYLVTVLALVMVGLRSHFKKSAPKTAAA